MNRAEARRAARRLLETNALYLDTETLDAGRRIHVVELALLDKNEKPLVDTLIKPKRIPATARFSKIPIRQILTGVPFPIALLKVIIATQNNTIATYNSPFDKFAMATTAAHYNLKLPVWKWIDALAIASGYFGEKIKLEEATQQLGILTTRQKHHARDDTKLLIRLIKKIAS